MEDGSGRPYYYHPDRGNLTQWQPPPGWVEVRQAGGREVREGRHTAGRAIPTASRAAKHPSPQQGTGEVLPSEMYSTHCAHPGSSVYANCAVAQDSWMHAGQHAGYPPPAADLHSSFAHANGFGGLAKDGMSVQTANTRKAPTCKVCGKLMKGHPRNRCKAAGLPMSSSQPQGRSASGGDQGTPHSAAQSVPTQASSLEGAGWSSNKRQCVGE